MSGWQFLVGVLVCAVGAFAFLKLVADDIALAEMVLRELDRRECKAYLARKERQEAEALYPEVGTVMEAVADAKGEAEAA